MKSELEKAQELYDFKFDLSGSYSNMELAALILAMWKDLKEEIEIRF